MYALVALLGLIAAICWLEAFATDPPENGSVRRSAALGFAVAFAAMLYTHNWAFFFGLATAAAGALVVAHAPSRERRRLLRTGLIAYGGAVLLYLPWVPTVLYQTAHTGAPWSNPPSLAALASSPAKLLGETAEIALVLAAGAGLVALVGRREGGRFAAPARAVLALAAMASVATSAGMPSRSPGSRCRQAEDLALTSPTKVAPWIGKLAPPLRLLLALAGEAGYVQSTHGRYR